MKLTNEIIEERRRENTRKAKQKWADNNREHLREYNRKWQENFKAEHGESYSTYRARLRAIEELKAEGFSE